MNVRYATDEEISRWDDLLPANEDGGNVFQATEMAETKRRGNWRPRYLMCGDLAVMAIEKTVPLLGNYWYIPKGPGVRTVDALRLLLESLVPFARTQRVFAIKIEPEILETPEAKAAIDRLGLYPTRPVQPNVSTVIVDLSPSLEEVMAAFNQKGRHALRRAERDGVTTKAVPITEENARTMYALLRETAAGRFDTSVRPFEYYKAFWEAYSASGRGSLFFAEFEGRIVAGAFSMYVGKKGLYKDGASVREKPAYGASHLLQWEVMKWMKARGVETYDLCGTPHSSRLNEPAETFYGVGRFKTSFNKQVTDYVGCYDIAVRPFAYRIWQLIARRVVISLTWRLKKQLWY